ncbi:cyclic nucleotide-binding domain-containing protein [Desulfobacterales bacterium HSG16]|nr:cyclic nucleotide-binding domain-containing protein [Desulfobacterales bacterium HSG16]
MDESEYLKDNIDNIRNLLTVQPLRESEAKSLKQLIRLSTIMEYEPDTPIIEEGNTDSSIYFLLSGKIRVVREGVEIGSIEKPGEIFGEMRIIDGLERSASVFAREKTICLAVNTSMAQNHLSQDERAALLLLLYRIVTEYSAIRLRLANEEIVEAKKEIEMLKQGGVS